MVRAIIADDEFYSREMLKQKLLDSPYDISIVALCESAEKALVEIIKEQPDIVFLDIQFGGNNGLWLAEQLSHIDGESFKSPDIIFITAYDDSSYLLEAFRLSAIDYLIKPVSIDLLHKSIEKFINRHSTDNKAKILMKNIETINLLKFQDFSGLLLLKAEDIAYLKADGNYALIALASGENVTIFERLGNIESRLPDDIFIRTGKSYIINKMFLRNINTRKSNIVLAINENLITLDIPDSNIKLLKEKLNL